MTPKQKFVPDREGWWWRRHLQKPQPVMVYDLHGEMRWRQDAFSVGHLVSDDGLWLGEAVPVLKLGPGLVHCGETDLG